MWARISICCSIEERFEMGTDGRRRAGIPQHNYDVSSRFQRALMKNVAPLVVVLAMCGPAHSWNYTGHLVSARLAWNQLDQDHRDKATKVLKNHPHYAEYLSAERPDGFTEAEWAFMRAATWADWVRSHHKAEFDHPTWHYINYPFVLPGSSIDPAAHQPPTDEKNIVQQLNFSAKQLKSGTREDQAVYLCWMMHLGGDIHQPLHTSAVFGEAFPSGDRGGNLAYAVLREGGQKVKLHPMWDGLLGNGSTASDIGKVVKEVESLIEANPELIKTDLQTNTTVESWAKESFEVSKTQAYLNGKLPLATDRDDATKVEIAPDDYAKNSGRTARIQVAKAGARLARLLTSNLE
jgi:S1/P1 Nuclease